MGITAGKKVWTVPRNEIIRKKVMQIKMFKSVAKLFLRKTVLIYTTTNRKYEGSDIFH